MTDRDWHVFRGTGEPHDGWESVPAPMVARTFDGGPVLPGPRGEEPGWRRRLGTHAVGAHQLRPENLDVINAAILCRRPLLVTGAPGLGKSSLAALIARELKLGPVLEWPITSRETLQDGLYHYDALRRFEEASLPLAAAPAASRRSRLSVAGRVPRSNRGARDGAGSADVADYLTLGPLGTALLPYDRPRVLVIVEIDKADVDLPNDLLHVFEDGEFSIPELRRMRAHRPKVRVAVHGVGEEVEIAEGHVRCSAFPIIVLTSNGDRDFPPAFLRRCLHLPLEDPDSGAARPDRRRASRRGRGARVRRRDRDLHRPAHAVRRAADRPAADRDPHPERGRARRRQAQRRGSRGPGRAPDAAVGFDRVTRHG